MVGNLDFHIGKRRRLAHVGGFGMAVIREWRSKGVGSALLDTLIRWAEGNLAIEKIYLHVLSSNDRAIRLYRKFGFIEEGRRVRQIKYAEGTYVDDILIARFVRALSPPER